MQRTTKKSCITGTKVQEAGRDWKKYNDSLVQRGNITLWIDPSVYENWYYFGPSQRGANYVYSPMVIELGLTFKALYKLGYRQTEGFVTSVLAMMQLDLDVPDYSTFNRRASSLQVKLPANTNQPIHIALDSTGLKVYGEGEWKVRQHGIGKRRTWIKVHLMIDVESQQIIECVTTTNSIHDSKVVDELIDNCPTTVKKFYGDGAYDKKNVYIKLKDHKIKPIIPPQKNARIRKHGNCKGKPLERDQAIRGIRKYGRKKWKKKIGYHKRSLAETAMFRYKNNISPSLYSRKIDTQKTEVRIGVKILNKMNLKSNQKIKAA